MDSVEFRKRNEELSRQYDVGEFLERSHSLIRFVEFKRIGFIIRMVNTEKPEYFLDVGCGNAFLLKKVNVKHGCGMDLSMHNITNAKKRLGPQSRYLLAQANAECLPFGGKKFDAVVCSEVIEHVQYPDFVLEEIVRVLKPQGSLIITIPNDSLSGKCKKIIEILGLRIKYGGAEEWHLHMFDRKQMENLLLKHGFRIKTTKRAPFNILPLRYVFHCLKA